MAPQRTERLLNLVIALVATRRWLTKEQIRRAVPQYAECETAEAFDRTLALWRATNVEAALRFLDELGGGREARPGAGRSSAQ